jgi:hypothetical protein
MLLEGEAKYVVADAETVAGVVVSRVAVSETARRKRTA